MTEIVWLAEVNIKETMIIIFNSIVATITTILKMPTSLFVKAYELIRDKIRKTKINSMWLHMEIKLLMEFVSVYIKTQYSNILSKEEVSYGLEHNLFPLSPLGKKRLSHVVPFLVDFTNKYKDKEAENIEVPTSIIDDLKNLHQEDLFINRHSY